MLNTKALAGTPSTPPVFVEDVFSTYLWDGNSTARNIVNGIDLATKGGMVWAKYRNATNSNRLYDTNRGATKQIFSDLTNAEQVAAQSLTSFNADGFSLGTGQPNENTATVVGWTFRKQAKFFDIVTYTGNGSNRTIAHNLGSVPGSIWVKRIVTTGDWQCYHRSLANTEYLVLNTTAAKATGTDRWNSTTPTSTEFSLGTNTDVNASGVTYIAYLFAHDAGGFGTAGTDNVISCGSFTASALTTVSLGYEPQYIMIKRTASTGNWIIQDVMRGMSVTGEEYLSANSAGAAGNDLPYVSPTATGFEFNGTNIGVTSGTFIYMAIRRPMKVPTTGTSVFSMVDRAGTGSAATVNSFAFALDAVFVKNKSGGFETNVFDRLRGRYSSLRTNSTVIENDGSRTDTLTGFDVQNGYTAGADTSQLEINSTLAGAGNYINWGFRRAPKFFDEVCYTGTGADTTKAHNLGVVPELMIIRPRNNSAAWRTYTATTGPTKQLALNESSAAENINSWNSTAPTASVFSVSGALDTLDYTYVAYLFATCAGVSKVGSYTGTGATQTINCGFTAGARFVLIKRTNSTGDWYVWDTARGIVSGNDPYLLLNSTAAEVTNTDYIDPVSSGFEISSTAPAAINASGSTFIFLAIA